MGSTRTLNFTKAAIEAAPTPDKGKRLTYRDKREAGLILVITHTDTKSFYLYKKIDGKPERVFIGRFPDMSLEQARKKAAKLKGQIADGRNPQNERRGVRQEATLGEFFADYLDRYSKRHKRSWKYDEREVNQFLKHWFKRKLSSIKRGEISNLHAKIGKENGTYAANHMLERIKSIYNKAIEWGWQGENPAVGIKKFPVTSRDRFLQPREMPRFYEAVMQEENKGARDFVLLCLFTGARKGNVLSMRWDDIDLERGTWRIPETKNGDPLTLPLSAHALAVLRTRWAALKADELANKDADGASESNRQAKGKKSGRSNRKASDSNKQADHSLANHLGSDDALLEALQAASTGEPTDLTRKQAAFLEDNEPLKQEFVLPGSGKSGHMADPKKAWARILKRAGIKDLRIHDLRRTLGSWQAAAGANAYVIGKSLGHKSQQSTAIYARLNLDPVRESVSRASDDMMRAFLPENASGNA